MSRGGCGVIIGENYVQQFGEVLFFLQEVTPTFFNRLPNLVTLNLVTDLFPILYSVAISLDIQEWAKHLLNLFPFYFEILK